MKSISCLVVCVVVAAGGLPSREANEQIPPADSRPSGTLGTSIRWVENPREAVQQARDDSKLVFLMQLSGDFRSSESTCNNTEIYRALALSAPEVGRYFKEHFVATFQKKGKFHIGQSDNAQDCCRQSFLDEMKRSGLYNIEKTIEDLKAIDSVVDARKQGGNVVSYFCTTDGLVLHLIPGPVNNECLLREAKWAVSVYEDALTKYDAKVSNVTRLYHILRTTHKQYQDNCAHHVFGDPESKGRMRIMDGSCETFAAHKFLGNQRTPLLKEIERQAFEKLIRERYLPDGENPAPPLANRRSDEDVAANQLKMAKLLMEKNPGAAQRRLQTIAINFPETTAAQQACELLVK